MNRKRNRNYRNNQERKSRKIIRCTMKGQPVFEHESCAEFKTKVSANDQKTCKNCTHSL